MEKNLVIKVHSAVSPHWGMHVQLLFIFFPITALRSAILKSHGASVLYNLFSFCCGVPSSTSTMATHPSLHKCLLPLPFSGGHLLHFPIERGQNNPPLRELQWRDFSPLNSPFCSIPLLTYGGGEKMWGSGWC